MGWSGKGNEEHQLRIPFCTCIQHGIYQLYRTEQL